MKYKYCAFTFEFNDAFECEMEYHPEERGSREGGQQMEPDYPEYVEISRILVNGTVDVTDYLSKDTLDKICEAAIEYIIEERKEYGYE